MRSKQSSVCSLESSIMMRFVEDLQTKAGKVTQKSFWFITAFMLPLQVLSSDPVLGAIIISTCVIFITFVILTLFVSIILEAFGEEQENHQVLYESLSHFLTAVRLSSISKHSLGWSVITKITLLILSLLKKRKSLTWCWWRSSVFLASNARRKKKTHSDKTT